VVEPEKIMVILYIYIDFLAIRRNCAILNLPKHPILKGGRLVCKRLHLLNELFVFAGIFDYKFYLIFELYCSSIVLLKYNPDSYR